MLISAIGFLHYGRRLKHPCSVFMTESKTPFCSGCEQRMRFIQAIPQSGALREIAVFYCHQCKHAETIIEKHAAQPCYPELYARWGDQLEACLRHVIS